VFTLVKGVGIVWMFADDLDSSCDVAVLGNRFPLVVDLFVASFSFSTPQKQCPVIAWSCRCLGTI